MKKIIRHIPNLLTLCNLLSGSIGVISVFKFNVLTAASFLWIGALFDFLDGFSARTLKAYSGTGKELDSLADLVTFGLLPSLILFNLISNALPYGSLIPYCCLLTVLFSALRLAKFNIDQDQKNIFTGLPTPANAFLLSGLPFLSEIPSMHFMISPGPVLITMVISSLLMISPIKFISLKFSSLSPDQNTYRLIILLISVILISILGIKGITPAVAAYIMISIVWNLIPGNKIKADNSPEI